MSNIIVMAWLLSLGFTPHSSLETRSGSIEASNCLIQTFGVGFYIVDHIYIYSTLEIRDTKAHGIYFDPFRGDFLIGGSIYFKNLSMGVSHECNHDIVTNMDLHKYNGWEAVFDQAYINYTIPFRISSGISITPSIILADQFTETVRIKNNNKKEYFNPVRIDSSPNIVFSGLRLETEWFFLRTRAAFQAGYIIHNNTWAYIQFNAGVELFYKNISLGFDYINRENMQKNAGYSLEGLTLFVRFQGKSSLL
jgi:hypothetical protein